MLTQDNTEGYTDAELTSANAELTRCLSGVEDQSQRHEIEKAFADRLDDFVVGLSDYPQCV